MGNSALVEVRGNDTIKLKQKKNEKIHNVLFVHDLDQNLLPVGQIMDHGYSLYFEDDRCIIFNKKMKDKR